MISRDALRRCGAVSAALFAVACGGSDEPVPLLWVSKGGVNTPASMLSNTFLAEATVDGTHSAPVVLDTGAPFSLLETDAFGGAVPDGIGMVGTLTIGGTRNGQSTEVTMIHVPTVGESGTLTVDAELFGGLIGFTAFGQFDFSLNYRDRYVSLGASALPADLQPAGATIAFTLAGGGASPLGPGSSEVLHYPASRVLVPVDVEGETHTLLVDSGASVVGLRQSVFDRLRADGRGSVEEQFALATGTSTSTVIRLRSVVVGGVEVTDPPAASGSGIEELMTTLTKEVGRQVDGMLGGTVLREFYVTIGYREGRLDLRRYATRDHIHDEYRRVAFAVDTSLGASVTHVVRQIYAGTQTARILSSAGITVGDPVLTVDGKQLPGDPTGADATLLGNVGETHTIRFEATALQTAVTLTLPVEELLPLP